MSLCVLNRKGDSCLPKKVIKDLEKKILPNNESNLPTNIIIEKLATKLKCTSSDNTSSKEICIIEKIKEKNNDSTLKKVMNKALLTYFKPVTKSFDGNYWMNNTDIDSIQYQFQTLFKGYYYSNIHMIDMIMFDPNNAHMMENCDKIKAIREINFVNELKGVNNQLTYNGELKNYGIVINTDLSSGGGVHWFSIFIDFQSTPITIEYFNSSGYDIKNINFKKYLINLADEITREVRKCVFVKVTDIQHQRNNTANCGGFSLFYIFRRLHGTPYEYFSNNKIIDEKIEAFRKFLFRLK
jgi:hypothetical protein